MTVRDWGGKANVVINSETGEHGGYCSCGECRPMCPEECGHPVSVHHGGICNLEWTDENDDDWSCWCSWQPEVHREEWNDQNPTCLGCGKVVVLHFNGGELDTSTCCGYRYSLEYVRIDLVIRQVESGPSTDR